MGVTLSSERFNGWITGQMAKLKMDFWTWLRWILFALVDWMLITPRHGWEG
jgi:hypothetical protein